MGWAIFYNVCNSFILDFFFNVITFGISWIYRFKIYIIAKTCLFWTLYSSNFDSYPLDASRRIPFPNGLLHGNGCKLLVVLWEKLVSCFLLGVKCLKWIKNVFPSPTHCCNLIKWISFSISFAPRLAKLGGTTQDEISYTIIQYFNGKSFNTTLIKCLLHVITHAIKLVDNLFNLQWNLMSSFH